jgi:TM2 domain-containing membrane protein YozV
MSDDTTRTDGWGASDAASSSSERSTTTGGSADPQRVGFCQDCGKPLTQETLRTVGTGVFCEPCLVARVGATPSTPGYTTVPPYTAVPPQAVAVNDPSPVLAAILGLIPGVGAMYNGQFAKGIAHLAIFAILVSLSDNVNGIFGLFVAGWVFYMSFEAYHTAIARRDGLPLPNAFGFNDIGERMGFGKSWGNINTARASASGTTPVPASPSQAANPAPGPAYVTTPTMPIGTAPGWVGYVPPTAFGSQAASPEATAAAMAEQIHAQALRDAGFGHAPYAQTYTGTASPYESVAIPAPSSVVVPTGRHFPIGALWLIALGVLILIANLLPDWKLTTQWWTPIFLAGLSIWLFTRRLHTGARIVCIIRWPVILMALAILLALHAAYLPITIGLTASILLIAFGTLLLLERMAGPPPLPTAPLTASPYADVPYSNAPIVDVPAAESPARAEWAASGNASHNPDDAKGGQ